MGKKGQKRPLVQAPYAIPFSSIPGVENFEFQGNEQESIKEGFTHEMWEYIKPGKERVFVLMVAEGYTYTEIAWMFDIKRQEVNKTMFDIRNRLVKLNIGEKYHKK